MGQIRVSHRYDDILEASPPTPPHPPMSRGMRGAQFAPFAALTGHASAVEETARVTQEEATMSPEQAQRLNQQLHWALQHPHEPVELTYFVPDVRKKGGAYQTHTATIARIDAVAGVVVCDDGVRIPLMHLQQLNSLSWTDMEDLYGP